MLNRKIKHFFLLIFLFAVCFFCWPAQAADTLSVSSAMFADKAFSKERNAFLPMERVYLVLDFIDVAPGKYALNADWITPWGNLERQTSYSFTLDKYASSYQVYFWLELRKKGPLARTITGSEYNEEHYGEWKVRVFLNGKDVAEQHFQIK